LHYLGEDKIREPLIKLFSILHLVFETEQSLSMEFRGKDTLDSMIAEPAMGMHDKQ
jgi:hypothetical protein